MVYARNLAEDALPNFVYTQQAFWIEFPSFFLNGTRRLLRDNAKKNKSYSNEWENQYDKTKDTIYLTAVKMGTDSSPKLKYYTSSLYLWLSAQRTKGDNAKLQRLITTQLLKKDIYYNAAARNGLLLYLTIANNKKLKSTANTLLETILKALTTHQVKGNLNTMPDSLTEKRCRLRFAYATANFLMAQQLNKQGYPSKASNYYKTAAKYSFDSYDSKLNNVNYDEPYLFAQNNKNLYNEAYLYFLNKRRVAKPVLLHALTDMALQNPADFIDHLRTFYNQKIKNGQSFKTYWINANVGHFIKAPQLDIQFLDGKHYSLQNDTNKNWTMLEFWGTWCGSCIQEHPGLQQFYLKTQQANGPKINIIALASYDTEDKVKSYMNDKKYTFPVAVVDKQLVKTFNVSEFPTKMLVTPQKQLILIPAHVDYGTFIQQITAL